MARIVLIYSGGSDSFTLLHYLRESGHTVLPLSFDYGQRHSKELFYVEMNCRALDLRMHVISLPGVFNTSKSALTSNASVPEGYYADENMKQTVVPNRNMILLSIAASYAISNDCEGIAYGAHQGDHTIYPDCRVEFVSAMSNALQLCDWKPPTLLVPFLFKDKRHIYRWGLDHGLNYAHTWTCYKGEDIACGKCGACVERLHAFHDIGETDPMVYMDREYWRDAVAGATA